jgi:hypothetical protein
MAASGDGISHSLTDAIHVSADGRAYLTRPFPMERPLAYHSSAASQRIAHE